MFKWNSILCLLAVLLTVSSSDKDEQTTKIKIPDECIGQRICTVKPEGYDELQANFNSLLPDYLRNYTEKVPNFDFEDRIDNGDHNCREIIKCKIVYMVDGYATVDSERHGFSQKIDEILCEPRTDPENQEQCFENLKLSVADYKAVCVPVFRKRPIYVFNKEGDKIFAKSIDVPVTCNCQVSIK